MTSLEGNQPVKPVEAVFATTTTEERPPQSAKTTNTSTTFAASSDDDDTRDVESNSSSSTAAAIYSTFTKNQKRFIITMTSFAAFISPVSSQIYLPAMSVIAEQYHTTSSQINLTVTTYMIVQGLAPSFMGNFADIGGRRPAYILAFTIYALSNLGLALQDNYAALLVLRAIQSAGSSATIAIGYGVAADIASAEERGKYMGSMSSGVMTALSIGPILGGLLSRGFGWRSVFWFLLIVSGSFLVTYIITMPETSRRLVGDGSIPLPSRWGMSGIQCLSRRRQQKKITSPVESDEPEKPSVSEKKSGFALFNPFKSLLIFKDKTASINIWHLGLVDAATIALQTSTANLFGDLYGLDSLKIGLCYLPCGIFGCIGSATMGYAMDLNYRRIARKRSTSDNLQGTFPFEKARLQIAMPLSILMSVTLLAYGWVLGAHVHLAIPLVLQGITGFCSSGLMSVTGTILVDLFPEQPATANAAGNLVRCWLGAVAAAVLNYMFTGMGWGWTFVFFGLIVAACLPALWLAYQRGLGWRMASKKVQE